MTPPPPTPTENTDVALLLGNAARVVRNNGTVGGEILSEWLLQESSWFSNRKWAVNPRVLSIRYARAVLGLDEATEEAA